MLRASSSNKKNILVTTSTLQYYSRGISQCNAREKMYAYWQMKNKSVIIGKRHHCIDKYPKNPKTQNQRLNH